jgi:hypothetical protein
MKDDITMDTPDGMTDVTVYVCDACDDIGQEQIYSFYWSQSGDILQQDAASSNKHICAACLLKFVDSF